MVKAVLYWLPVSLRSFWRPKTDALAMLVRSRKASRYMRLRTGITRRSILETSLRWEAGHISVSALLLQGKKAEHSTDLSSSEEEEEEVAPASCLADLVFGSNAGRMIGEPTYYARGSGLRDHRHIPLPEGVQYPGHSSCCHIAAGPL